MNSDLGRYGKVLGEVGYEVAEAFEATFATGVGIDDACLKTSISKHKNKLRHRREIKYRGVGRI